MRFLKLTIAYDGADYVGWQVQPNGISIQQVLEQAWSDVTQESLRITASGRTDSGVHAEGQVCSVGTQTSLGNETLLRALNAKTPDDVAILNVQTAPEGFHAIRDAVRKTYRYQIQFGRIRDALQRRKRWFVPALTEVTAMQEAVQYLVGRRDFASFQSSGSERNSTERNLSRLDIREFHDSVFGYLDISMTSDGFLYNMVRNIVGTLVAVGQGSQPAEWVEWVVQQHDRRVAGSTAPAHALFLVDVEYDEEFI